MFFRKGSLIQLTVGILLCVAFLLTVAWVQPFQVQVANVFKVGTVREQSEAVPRAHHESHIVQSWHYFSQHTMANVSPPDLPSRHNYVRLLVCWHVCVV